MTTKRNDSTLPALLAGAVLCLATGMASAGPEEGAIPPAGAAQINAILAEKASRTPAERKLDSNLLYGMRAVAQAAVSGSAPSAAPPQFVQDFLQAHVAQDNTVKVTIRGTVSEGLLRAIEAVGATELNSFPQYNTIYARVPIGLLLAISGRPEVSFVEPFEAATTQRYIPSEAELAEWRRLYGGAGSDDVQSNAGSVTSQGVTAHKANKAFLKGVTGRGVKVCVLSDGVNSLAARQSTGDLPAVTVVAGQAGSGDEGTAMLELIHDIAPDAALGFATGFSGTASMASNILALRAAPHSCDIIVDDVTYFLEAPFQDDVIAQAVNSVTSDGALYFSSAANSGSLAKGTSGTWEGDFVNSGTSISAISAVESGTIHSFAGVNANTLTAQGSSKWQVLSWSDPINASANDYDLFILNSTMTTVVAQSTNIQSGSQPGRESISATTIPAGSKIVILNYLGTAATRALRLDTERGRLSIGTAGNTFGHNAAASAITVAAVNVATAGGGAFVGGASNPVETYSSDGPRRMFYTPAGAAITPGKVTFGAGGGVSLNKVDLTAADCAATATAGFTTFCGTSAAAPHAAAIAALIKSANRNLTASQIKALLTQSKLDIEALGYDVNSGVGLVMADTPVNSVLANNMKKIVPVLSLLLD